MMTVKAFVESRNHSYGSLDVLNIADHLLFFHKEELENGEPAMMKGFFVMVIAICKSLPHMNDVDPETKKRAVEWLKSRNFKGLMGEEL